MFEFKAGPAQGLFLSPIFCALISFMGKVWLLINSAKHFQAHACWFTVFCADGGICAWDELWHAVSRQSQSQPQAMQQTLISKMRPVAQHLALFRHQIHRKAFPYNQQILWQRTGWSNGVPFPRLAVCGLYRKKEKRSCLSTRSSLEMRQC